MLVKIIITKKKYDDFNNIHPPNTGDYDRDIERDRQELYQYYSGSVIKRDMAGPYIIKVLCLFLFITVCHQAYINIKN